MARPEVAGNAATIIQLSPPRRSAGRAHPWRIAGSRLAQESLTNQPGRLL
jgi:hypothetical protein